MFKIKVCSRDNLLAVKFFTEKGEDLAEAFNEVGRAGMADPEYREGMDVILDYRGSELPENQLYYNDLSRRVDINTSIGRLVRVMEKERIETLRNLNVYTLFFRGHKFFGKIMSVHSVQDAFEALGKRELYDDYEGFFESGPE